MGPGSYCLDGRRSAEVRGGGGRSRLWESQAWGDKIQAECLEDRMSNGGMVQELARGRTSVRRQISRGGGYGMGWGSGGDGRSAGGRAS